MKENKMARSGTRWKRNKTEGRKVEAIVKLKPQEISK